MDRKNTNDDLKVKIEAVVNKMSIGDVYKPYVTDILIRRAKTFSFTEAQIQTDLDTISKSLVDIRFKNLNIDLVGVYIPGEKKIGINPTNIFFSTNKDLYQTLAHEVYHALTYNEQNEDRLGGRNCLNGYDNVTLREVWVETASFRTIYNKSSKNPYFNSKSSGYNDMMFMRGMLEAAYGVSEQELLKHSVQSREEIINFLSQKTGKSTEEEDIFLDCFELNCNVIHEALYEKKNFLVNGKNVQMALARMGQRCAVKMRERLINLDYDSLSMETIEDFEYNYNKLNYIMRKTQNIMSLRYPFSNILKKDSRDFNRYNKDIIEVRRMIEQNKALKVAGIVSGKKDMDDIIHYAKWGMLHENDLTSKELKDVDISREPYNIKISDGNTKKPFKITKQIIERNKGEDYHNNDLENPRIYSNIKRDFIFGNLVRNVKKLFTREVKALPSGEPDKVTSVEQEKETQSWVLSPEQLDEVKRVEEKNHELQESMPVQGRDSQENKDLESEK